MSKVLIPIHPAKDVDTASRLQGASKQRKREAPKGRRVDPQALVEVQALLGDAPRTADLLIEHLHKIQDHYKALSAAHLAALAQELRLAQTEVYEVATFYHHFDVVKENEAMPAALTVRVCNSLSCEMAGAQSLLDRLPALLGAEVRVIAAPCIGRCEQAPAVVVGQHSIAQADLIKVEAAVQNGQLSAEVGLYMDYAAYQAQGGYTLLKECVSGSLELESVLRTMEDSGLRGLGGAGFPAGRKWRIVGAEAGPRLMAVNIDEGEPGTFKDRFYLERDPHRFLEGMLVAAWAVGIADIYIYLRDEYHACRAILEQELLRLRTDAPIATMPTIHLRRGAGAYICGDGRERVGGGVGPGGRVAGSAAEGVDGGHSGSGIACACGTSVSTGAGARGGTASDALQAGCGSGEVAVGVLSAVQARVLASLVLVTAGEKQ